MKTIIVFFILFAVVCSSCEYVGGKRISGNGVSKTETRTPSGDFHGIDVSGQIDVYLTQDSSYSVKVETDENLQEYIQVTNDAGILRIHPEKGFDPRPSHAIKVYVSSTSYKSIEASGSCTVTGQTKITGADGLHFDCSGSCDVKLDLNAPSVNADLSGACSLDLKGETKDFSMEGSGSSTVKSLDLMAENVSLDISGSGKAEVYASVKLHIQISGAGTVRYKGNAAVSQDVSGSVSIEKIQ